LLIYDAQYTPEQLRGEKAGWGHSSWLEGTRIAQEGGVRCLALFHYDPDHDDALIDGLVERARQVFPQTLAAAEGLQLQLPEGTVIEPGTWVAERRREGRYHVELPVRVKARGPDGELREVQGRSRDISRSGIYFVVPEEIPIDTEMDVEMVLPDEVTQRGDLELRFAAQPLWKEQYSGAQPGNEAARGVGARIARIAAKGRPKTGRRSARRKTPRR